MFADRHRRNVLKYDVPLAIAPTSHFSTWLRMEQ
jgi:hypothetical protein